MGRNNNKHKGYNNSSAGPQIEELIKPLRSKQNDNTKFSSCLHSNTNNLFRLTKDLVLLCRLNINCGSSDPSTFEKLKRKVSFNKFVYDPEFGHFLFSTATNMIIMERAEGENLSQDEMEFVKDFLYLGINIKYYYIPQSKGEDLSPCTDLYRKRIKYIRDCRTYRGMINICSRETREFCNCMEEKKLQAKKMDKIGICDGCIKHIPKHKLELCGGCISYQYCNIVCQKKHWIEQQHKVGCKKLNFEPCERCKIPFPAIQLKSCTRCYNARYCSKICQEEDWSSHKQVCSYIKNEG
jgi:hypothetical protein